MEFNDRTILKSIVVKGNLANVWEKWTTSEGLITFFPPMCNMELKIGGPFEMFFLLDAEKGGQGSEGCKVLSYLPNSMLSFSWNAPPSIPSVRDHAHKAWVVINFTESDGDVFVELNHIGFLKGEDWDKTIDYFEVAWGRVLDRLKNTIENA